MKDTQSQIEAALYDKHKQLFTSVVMPVMLGTTFFLVVSNWRHDREFYMALGVCLVLDFLNPFFTVKNRVIKTPFGTFQSRSDGFDTFRWCLNLIADLYLVWALQIDQVSASVGWIIVTLCALFEVYYFRNRMILLAVATICYGAILWKYKLDWTTNVYVMSCFLGMMFILYKFERWLVETITNLLKSESNAKVLIAESDVLRREAVLGSQMRSICHEINNVLSIIQGSADHLRNGQNLAPDKYAKSVDRIARAVSTLSRVSLIVLDDIGDPKQSTRLYAISELYVDMEILLYRHFKNTEGVAFSMDLEAQLDLTDVFIQERPGATYLVLHNITKNAIEACQEFRSSKQAPTVTVSACVNGDRLLISIKDNAGGLPDDIKEALLSGGKVQTSKSYGHGLGLQFVAEQIQKSQIGLVIDSNADGGTQFTLNIPIVARGSERKTSG